jgi:hypothetical protein
LLWPPVLPYNCNGEKRPLLPDPVDVGDRPPSFHGRLIFIDADVSGPDEDVGRTLPAAGRTIDRTFPSPLASMPDRAPGRALRNDPPAKGTSMLRKCRYFRQESAMNRFSRDAQPVQAI